MIIRTIFRHSFEIPHTLHLRPAQVLTALQKRVNRAEERRGNECPIYFHAISGERDRLVPEASASGAGSRKSFSHLAPLVQSEQLRRPDRGLQFPI